jgi:hypothetical protein
MADEQKAVTKATGAVRAERRTLPAEGFVRVEILHETYVPAEGGGHQKVIAGAVVDLPGQDAAHLIRIGKAKFVA